MDDEPRFTGESESLESFLTQRGVIRADISAAEIEARANTSVKKALDYFKKQNIYLGYTPSVKYTGELCKFNANLGAAVDADLDFYKNAISLIGATSMKITYERQFGLIVSDEALNEAVEVAKKDLETMFPNGILGDDADIFLFKPIQNIIDNLDEWMVHEVWHLIEKKYDVLKGGEFIREGTATYVQNRFIGKQSEWKGKKADYFRTTYDNVAYLVQEEVKKEQNPLQVILNPERRRSIQKRFEEKVLPLFYQKAADMIESGATKEFARELILSLPEYEDFRRDPNKQNLLKAMRLRGNVKLADELCRQDTSKLVQYNRELLN